MLNELVPELSENEKDRYGTLIHALDSNELRLVRLRNVETSAPVAGLCVIRKMDDGTFHISPIARLIDEKERLKLVVETKFGE